MQKLWGMGADWGWGVGAFVCVCVCVCGVCVCSLMVADVIPPTLSRTNSPTSQHNDHPFKSFNNHTTLPITRKTHAIHTHDLGIYLEYTNQIIQKYIMTFHIS